VPVCRADITIENDRSGGWLRLQLRRLVIAGCMPQNAKESRRRWMRWNELRPRLA